MNRKILFPFFNFTRLWRISLCSTFCIFNSAFSQNPQVKIWDYRYGGDHYEYLYTLIQTDDGGYMLGGYSESGISGDKTEMNRGVTGFDGDFWIIKLNAQGL